MTDAAMPRAEIPRPQFHRADWLCLNGRWQFAIDPDGRVEARQDGGRFDREITVPFAPESALSGIGETGFMESVWYRREVEVPADWSRVLLNFGAVDWQAKVWVNGALAGTHRGGSTGFRYDITDLLVDGRGTIVVHARDLLRSGKQPAGKQSRKEHSWGCYYTRTTGIWQSVWLEAAGDSYLTDVAILTTADGQVTLTPEATRLAGDPTFRVIASLEGKKVADVEAPLRPGLPVSLTIPEPRLWQPGAPVLYDLVYEIRDGDTVVDQVSSYCGLRDVRISDGLVLLNGVPLYQRLVLDQGFYPDGIWTAPSDDALRADIEISMQMGFNGARLHQKVFEPRWHYWADRLGYLTWSESPSWGAEPEDEEANGNMLEEWAQILRQTRNHPSIIAWTPLNETGWGKGRNDPIEEPHLRLVERAAALTRLVDPSRPVNDASGWVHRDTDIWTVHSYQQDPAKLHAQLAPYPDVYRDAPQSEPVYADQPYILDEFGGAAFDPAAARDFANNDEGRDRREEGDAWGYGKPPTTAQEFEQRIRAQVAAVNDIPHMQGWCYTQLTDVEQEQNGLLTYDRRPKLPLETYREIFSHAPERARGRVAAE